MLDRNLKRSLSDVLGKSSDRNVKAD